MLFTTNISRKESSYWPPFKIFIYKYFRLRRASCNNHSHCTLPEWGKPSSWHQTLQTHIFAVKPVVKHFCQGRHVPSSCSTNSVLQVRTSSPSLSLSLLDDFSRKSAKCRTVTTSKVKLKPRWPSACSLVNHEQARGCLVKCLLKPQL